MVSEGAQRSDARLEETGTKASERSRLRQRPHRSQWRWVSGKASDGDAVEARERFSKSKAGGEDVVQQAGRCPVAEAGQHELCFILMGVRSTMSKMVAASRGENVHGLALRYDGARRSKNHVVWQIRSSRHVT